jgi:hypothetical protein
MKNVRMSIKSSVMGFIFFVLSLLVSAQGFQMEGPQSDRTKLGVRFLHPDFEEAEGLSLFSGLYQLSLSVHVSPKLNVVVKLPIGSVAGDDIESQTGFGNIYAGIQYKLKDSKKTQTSASLGVYLPTANKNKGLSAFIGMYSNFSRFFQFLPETVTVSLNLTYYHLEAEGLFFGAEVGPDVIIPNEEYYTGEVELFIHYGLTTGYRFNNFEIKGEFVGLGILSEEVDSFSDRFFNKVILGLNWIGGRIRPGLFYKVNLDKDIRDFVRGAFGFSINYIVN